MRAIECIPEFLWKEFDLEALNILKTLEIQGVSQDSRTLQKGDLFIALDGTRYDAIHFVKEAVERGAIAILLQKRKKEDFKNIEETLEEREGIFYIKSVPFLFTKNDPRAIVGHMAACIYPKKPKYIFAVTGTNGKTSVSFFIRDIMVGLGFPAAAMGTIGIFVKNNKEKEYIEKVSSLTTPDSITLYKMLCQLSYQGVEAVALEASSHGLDQGRLLGISLSAAGFTNLTPEHLDYHPTMEEYFQAKSLLFKDLLPSGKTAVLNADSPEYAALKVIVEENQQKLISYGYKGDTFQFKDIRPDQKGSFLDINIGSTPYTLFLPIVGEFQVYNVFCALGMVMGALGIEPSSPKFLELLKTVALLKAPPGRLEYIGETSKGAAVYVDYAHTPDAFERVLKTLRPYAKGDLWILFGCGGDRDPYKRPLMGKIACLNADHIVLTDDNPRMENPETIRKMIKIGISKETGKVTEIPDRRQALLKIIPSLKRGDILLLAGKGHEEGQIIGKEIFPYNDAKTAREILQNLASIEEHKGENKK